MSCVVFLSHFLFLLEYRCYLIQIFVLINFQDRSGFETLVGHEGFKDGLLKKEDHRR